MTIRITEDLLQERGNPTPIEDLAPSPKLYQTYLQAWYRRGLQETSQRENNPTADDDLAAAARVPAPVPSFSAKDKLAVAESAATISTGYSKQHGVASRAA